MAMICSSENRLRFIVRLLSKGRILAPSGLNCGGHIMGNEGDEVVMSVSYLDSLPRPIEPEAHVWSVEGKN
jgi:hypothetical protein